MFTLVFRIPLKAWTPVVELFWWQALLTEKLITGWSRWSLGLLWLVLYTLAAIGSCLLLEGAHRKPARAWMRALSASLVFQALILLLAFRIAPE